MVILHRTYRYLDKGAKHFMKKKLLALFTASLILLSAVLTGCSTTSATEGAEGDEEIISGESITARNAETVTIVLPTGENTTAEAIAKVEKAINNITKQRFKTKVVLKYFKEDEYDAKLEELIKKAEEESKANAGLSDEEAAKEKEAKRIAAIDKLMAKDAPLENKINFKPLGLEFVARDTEEETTAEVIETEESDLGEGFAAVQKYPTATEGQIDIFLVKGTENLTKYVKDENYSVDGGPFLVSMDEWLTLDSKALYQYINPTVLMAGKVEGSTYAIPTNKQIASEYKYIVLDKELVKKYDIDQTKITSLTSKETVKFLKAIKDGETDIAPMLKRVDDAPGIVGLFSDKDTIFGTYLSNTSAVGFKTDPKNLLSSYQYTDHYIYMEQYERNGYFAENPTDDTRFGLAVMTGDEDFGKELEDSGKYYVTVLEKPIATSETTGDYMLGISSHTTASDRCMELITYINTNSEIRNLLQYGIAGENYKIDGDTGKLVRLDNTYMMDIYSTGNAFIAYPEEGMELDAWEKAMATNRSALVSPYLGFIFMKESNEALIEKVKKLSDDMLKRIEEYDPEADRVEQIKTLGEKLTQTQAELAKLKNEYATAVSAYARYESEVKRLQGAIDAATAILDKANTDHAPFAAELSLAKTAMEAKSAELEKAKAEEKPDDELIKKLEGEYTPLKEAYDKALKDAEPTQKAVNDAKKVVEDATKVLNDYLATKVGETTDEEGKTVDIKISDLKSNVETKDKQVKTAEKTIETTQTSIDNLNYTEGDTEAYDQIVKTLYNNFFKSLVKELEKDVDYATFMSSENENGILYIYNEWYSASYAS